MNNPEFLVAPRKPAVSQNCKIWLFINLIGILLYLHFASAIWRPIGETNLPGGAGDPIVWGLTAFPVLAVFFIGNLIWLTRILFIVKNRENRIQMAIWLLVVATWIGMNRYDSYRQFAPDYTVNGGLTPGSGR